VRHGAPVGNAIVPPGLLTSDILPRKVTYCCVTGDELDAYANWGLILNACLTLFGITASASLTCCLA